MEENKMELCSICCCSLEKNIEQTLCKHSFHIACLNDWKLISDSCPICRQDLLTHAKLCTSLFKVICEVKTKGLSILKEDVIHDFFHEMLKHTKIFNGFRYDSNLIYINFVSILKLYYYLNCYSFIQFLFLIILLYSKINIFYKTLYCISINYLFFNYMCVEQIIFFSNILILFSLFLNMLMFATKVEFFNTFCICALRFFRDN